MSFESWMGSLEMSLSKIGPNEIPLDSPWIRLEGARRTRDGPVGKLKGARIALGNAIGQRL